MHSLKFMFKPVLPLVLFLLITNHSIFSQKTVEAIFFTSNKQINKFHTISDLETKQKGELIKIYQERIEEIMTVLPFLSLTNQPGTRLKDIGIKEDSRHLKILKNKTESTEKNLEVTKEAIEELIAYADTGKIIWTILYYEEIIKKMRIGVNGNF